MPPSQPWRRAPVVPRDGSADALPDCGRGPPARPPRAARRRASVLRRRHRRAGARARRRAGGRRRPRAAARQDGGGRRPARGRGARPRALRRARRAVHRQRPPRPRRRRGRRRRPRRPGRHARREGPRGRRATRRSSGSRRTRSSRPTPARAAAPTTSPSAPSTRRRPRRAARRSGSSPVRHAAAHVALPWFAIGGIDAGTVGDVVDAGATRAVSSARSRTPPTREAVDARTARHAALRAGGGRPWPRVAARPARRPPRATSACAAATRAPRRATPPCAPSSSRWRRASGPRRCVAAVVVTAALGLVNLVGVRLRARRRRQPAERRRDDRLLRGHVRRWRPGSGA